MIYNLKSYPAYKDSGVSWLGKAPEHWVELPLKRIARIDNSGCYGVEPEYGDQSLPVATTAQINRDGHFVVEKMSLRGFSHDEVYWYGCNPGDILVVKSSGSIFNVITGKAGLVDEKTPKFVFSNFLMRVLPDSFAVNSRFLFLLLTSHLTQERVKCMVSGTTYPNLRMAEYASALLPLPPLAEQAAIVRFLDHADRRIRRYIRTKQKLIKLLEEQKQAIIHRAVTRGLDPNVRLKPSGVKWLGDIPEHWEVHRAKHLFREVDDRSTTGTEVLLSLRMYQGLVPHNEVSTIPITPQALIGFKKVEPGQIVMNRMRAAIGMFGIANQLGLVSPDYAVFEPIANVDAAYFLRLFKTPAAGTVFRVECKGLGTGSSGFMRLYTDRFGMIKLPIPPQEEQRRIVRGIAASTQEIECAEERTHREISLLREYRTRLIADVVTGRLDVREAAARLPDEAEAPEPLDNADTLTGAEEEAAEGIYETPEEQEA